MTAKVIGYTELNKVTENKEYAKSNTMFRNIVKTVAEKLAEGTNNTPLELVDQLSTKRQAGKFRRGKGIVYKTWEASL